LVSNHGNDILISRVSESGWKIFTQDIVLFAIVAVIYIAGLVAFLLKRGPYRDMEPGRRRYTIIMGIIGGAAMIYLGISLVLKLVR
jgi:hypothetical protein